MNLDEQLRAALQDETKGWVAPPELKERVLKQVASTQGGKKMKKWLVAGIVAAALLIPTGAYAGYNYLADTIYGSQENVAQFGVTQQQYDQLEAKLQGAEQNFSEEEFAKLMSLLKELGNYNLKIADSKGVLHPEQLSANEQVAYTKLTAELEPYFAKLNKETAPSNDTSWSKRMKQAEQTFSEVELADFKRILNEMKNYNDITMDSDGSVHMDRLSETDKINHQQLYDQIKPYTDKLGTVIMPPK
ncbi:DUF3600 domain-containing protein [Paenibacillus wynnii]|uniref:DUF3600 domain-containing protein n=1 Tax=Paenibacillus wynnii TaxID=268407 RepID=A0A098M954_9BACL|nr:DUF3600 domain-containing protein [Paenibacillus wynnii]KGE19085.1 hypothetical protein PWYN_06800 [Paenibacillus wynnii]